ncbi:CLUMA_CG020773, isoform A [Clunio marinus]|uniref:CLUMA_CG020773, isoform A n=1 Tax=Clunio marinus TaxID=568069 RepID=A0A1J1J5Y7_9DIPT|nr:CLUMA_CG020773, isoform A [Clunio marinus]
MIQFEFRRQGLVGGKSYMKGENSFFLKPERSSHSSIRFLFKNSEESCKKKSCVKSKLRETISDQHRIILCGTLEPPKALKPAEYSFIDVDKINYADDGRKLLLHLKNYVNIQLALRNEKHKLFTSETPLTFT